MTAVDSANWLETEVLDRCRSTLTFIFILLLIPQLTLPRIRSRGRWMEAGRWFCRSLLNLREGVCGRPRAKSKKSVQLRQFLHERLIMARPPSRLARRRGIHS